MIGKNNAKRKTGTWLTILIWIAVAGLLLSGCGIADNAADEGEVYRVGLLSGVDAFNSTIEGFKAEMAELGYVEGENITYDFQAASSDSEKMKQIAAEFVADEVDLIFTTTTGGVKVAWAATAGTEIPVIFTIVTDPVEAGVVDDLRQPGGNVTGVNRPSGDLYGKRIEFLSQMAPDAKRLWVPHNPEYPTAKVSLPAVRQAAPTLGIELVEAPVNTPDEMVAELNRRSGTDDPGFDAIMIMPDTTVQSDVSWKAILAFANEQNLPILGNVPKHVEQGALFTYSDDNFETGQLAAPMADKILRGATPATIPVAFGEPHLFINYKTAQTLGLTVDEGLLARASKVIH